MSPVCATSCSVPVLSTAKMPVLLAAVTPEPVSVAVKMTPPLLLIASAPKVKNVTPGAHPGACPTLLGNQCQRGEIALGRVDGGRARRPAPRGSC